MSDGWIKCFTFLQFSATALPSKVVKKYGRKRFAGIMDWDDALLVFWSTVPLLLLALILKGYLPELSKLSIYYALWNLIPIGQLDGSRLFFGSRVLFIFTWVITLAAAWIALV